MIWVGLFKNEKKNICIPTRKIVLELVINCLVSGRIESDGGEGREMEPSLSASEGECMVCCGLVAAVFTLKSSTEVEPSHALAGYFRLF